MRVFFDRELDTVATYWRVFRRDGVTLGFTSHDRDLYLEGICHKSAPGMVPAAIRRTTELNNDSAEVEGALSHDSITAEDLAAGLFDAAAIEIGVIDWESLEHSTLYSGRLGRIDDNQREFVAELRSAKTSLQEDLVPRTSPTCRAEFCGPGCTLSAFGLTSVHIVTQIDFDANRVSFDDVSYDLYIDGKLRFLAGPQTGLTFGIVSADPQGLVLDRALSESTELGTRTELLEGCDHTLATCTDRFNNAANFRGEPFLPGNDLLSRYGRSTG